VPSENKPVDLFSDGSGRIDPVGVCLQRVDAGVKFVVGYRARNESPRSADFSTKLGQSGAIVCRTT
jgi:hypothetical protein